MYSLCFCKNGASLAHMCQNWYYTRNLMHFDLEEKTKSSIRDECCHLFSPDTDCNDAIFFVRRFDPFRWNRIESNFEDRSFFFWSQNDGHAAFQEGAFPQRKWESIQ